MWDSMEWIPSIVIGLESSWIELRPGLMNTWLITNYGGPARFFGDIVSNLSRKSKPMLCWVAEKRSSFLICYNWVYSETGEINKNELH